MKIMSMLAAVAVLSTSYALDDCATIRNDVMHRTNTSGAIRLTMLHTQHQCSPVRRQTDPPPSWRHSLALDRERQLEARLLFRRRPAPRNLSTPVTSTIAGGMHGFMAQVAIGTPPRTQAVLIDSAASLSWVQCDPCVRNGCYDQDGPLFDTWTSSTYTKVPCSTQLCQSVAAVVRTSCSAGDRTCLYRVPYMDWSASEGSVSRDTLTVGEEKIPGFVFGCSGHYERTFGRYAGIFGFANDRVSFFSQVVEKCGQYRAFSYYLPSPSSAGYIQVGSYDEGGLAFTPMFIDNQDYFLALTGITVDGVPLDLASTNFSGQPQPGPSVFVMFLDLGSPLSILPSKVYNRLCDAVAKGIKGYDRIQSGQGCCFDPSFLATERAVPTAQMHFRNGVRLVLNEARLTYETPDEKLCLAFQSSTRFLLGSMQLLMTYVVQDVEKSIMGFPKT